MTRVAPGIELRMTRKGEKRYRAEAWDPTTQKRCFKTFPTFAAAKSWRSSMQVKIASGEVTAADSPTLNTAWAAWLGQAQAGVIRNKSGRPYKPSVLRGYEGAMRLHVLPALGGRKLSDIRTPHVQALVDRLVASGEAARTVRNHVAPLRVLYKDAIRRETARHNPAANLALPTGETARDRIATPAEARVLLAALPTPEDRVIWALAFYAGLRAGELMALEWESVDLTACELRVSRSYDPPSQQFVSPKTKRGERVVPFPKVLLPYLVAVRRPGGLVCGENGVTPYSAKTIRERALKAWGWRIDPKTRRVAGPARDDVLEPITPHECRHTYASLMLGAGVDIVKVSKWMGHSSIQITVDRYGHLVPGDETVAMDRFDAYLSA